MIRAICILALGGMLGCGAPASAADPVEPVEVADLGGQAEDGARQPTDGTELPPEQGTEPMSTAAPPDVAAPPAAAEVTRSGLASRVLRPGTGTEHPGPRDRVTVHYVGWTTDGQRFDSSIERGSPSTFGLHQVIAGWTEGVQLMVEGERRRLWIPEDLAYGGRPGAPQGMLVFDVELLEIGR